MTSSSSSVPMHYPTISAGALRRLNPSPSELEEARRKNELAVRNQPKKISRGATTSPNPTAEIEAAKRKSSSAIKLLHPKRNSGAMASLDPTPSEIEAAKMKNASALLRDLNIGDEEDELPSVSPLPSQLDNAELYPTLDTKPTATEEEPAYLRNDPGLACLTSQLGRINAQLRILDSFKKQVADAKDKCIRDLEAAASKAKESVASSSSSANDYTAYGEKSQSNSLATPSAYYQDDVSSFDQWVKHWDTEVGAEYWYNTATGEASWLDPRYGNFAG